MDGRIGYCRCSSAAPLLPIAVSIVIVEAWAGAAGQRAESAPGLAAPGQQEQVVRLREIPVWQADERVRYLFLRGHDAETSVANYWEARYPALQSVTPLYGAVNFTSAGERQRFRLLVDHSQGISGTYDLLYFDENADANLANDRPRRPVKEMPAGVFVKGSLIKEEIFFESVRVPFDFGPEGRQLVEIIPRLWIFEGREPRLSFVPAAVRTGNTEINGTPYTVFLGYGYAITGRFDQPTTSLLLLSRDGEPPKQAAGEMLNAMHRLGDRYCRFSCTPTGDQLLVRPYDGPCGTFALAAGGRDVEKLEMYGTLASRDATVAVNAGVEDGWPKPAQRCEIPAGDYRLTMLYVYIGNLRCVLSTNPYGTAMGWSHGESEPVYHVKIRENRPFLLDLCHKPTVVFVAPEEEQRVNAGSEIRIQAVLVDPVLNVMIRRLDDMARGGRKTYTLPFGRVQTCVEAPSLDPKFIITRADGEVVARGVMPFGWNSTCGYSWRVPNDLKLSGSEETLAVEVTYDTQELYGTVQGKREIVVTGGTQQ